MPYIDLAALMASIGADRMAAENRVSPLAIASRVRQPPMEWETAIQGLGRRDSKTLSILP